MQLLYQNIRTCPLSFCGLCHIANEEIAPVYENVKLEVYPHGSTESSVIEIKGAKALCALYVSGATFSLIPSSPIDAIVLELDGMDAEKINTFPNADIYAVALPGPKTVVFFDLHAEYPYRRHAELYREAFAHICAYFNTCALAYHPEQESPKRKMHGVKCAPPATPSGNTHTSCVIKRMNALARQRMFQAAYLRRKYRLSRLLHKKEKKPYVYTCKPGRKPTIFVNTLEELDALYAAKGISKPYYHKKHREMVAALSDTHMDA